MGPRVWILLAAILGASGVALGAYQAHGLQQLLDNEADIEPETKKKRLENCATAVRYQLVHAVALLGLSALCVQLRSRLLNAAGVLWLIGTVGFAGPLYLYSIAGWKGLVHVVPMGGVSLIVGWVLLGVAACLLQFPSTHHRGAGAEVSR